MSGGTEIGKRGNEMKLWCCVALGESLHHCSADIPAAHVRRLQAEHLACDGKGLQSKCSGDFQNNTVFQVRLVQKRAL